VQSPEEQKGLDQKLDVISKLPFELKVKILRLAGPVGYFKSMRLASAWRDSLRI